MSNVDKKWTDENVEVWYTELCHKCDMMGFDGAFDDENLEKQVKWICVGEIIRPEIPKTTHEEYNKIRICLLKSLKPFDVVSFEWTPWEASRVLVALGVAIGNVLVVDQPLNQEE